MKKMYLIGEVSRKVKLSQKRIREYEKGGFISPVRDAKTNNRHYTDFDIKQIKQIKNLIHVHGLTISCLKVLLKSAPCWNIFNCKKTAECEVFKKPQTRCYVTMKGEPDSTCKTCPIFLNRGQKPFKILVKET
jgi:DNA-binding transcriptional MerR regulator